MKRHVLLLATVLGCAWLASPPWPRPETQEREDPRLRDGVQIAHQLRHRGLPHFAGRGLHARFRQRQPGDHVRPQRPAQALKPGELKLDRVGKFTFLADQAVQDYVASIGRRLIPAFQAELSDTDPRKIPFRFHVVLDDEANAFATPNGIVVVHSGLIELLETKCSSRQ